jgi:hypothetical protein
MFKTIDEAVAVYREKLVEYRRCLRKIQRDHRRHPECNAWSPQFDPFSKNMKPGTYDNLYSWYLQLLAMRKVLGMTSKEDDQVATKVGLPQVRYVGPFLL